MPSYQRAIPRIAWNTGLTTIVFFGYPIDNVRSGDEPRAASEWVQSPSGIEEAWITGTDYVMTFTWRWIPQVFDGTATGWDDAGTGVRAFLAWARQKNAFTFERDGTFGSSIAGCYLVEPMQGQPEPEEDGTRILTLKIRNPTTPFDGY
jgi:hypothetical protein